MHGGVSRFGLNSGGAKEARSLAAQRDYGGVQSEHESSK